MIRLDRIVVLIPCYNEVQTIGKVVSDWKEALPEAVIYVYDNNSTDGTARAALQAGAVVRYEHQQGKGNVIRRMFREIDAECYIMIDGDDTYPAGYGREMAAEVLEKQVDMVVGDRLSSTYFQENKSPFHNLGNSLVRSTINRLFKSNIRDIMTGYRAFSYQFVKSFPVLSQGFFFTLATLLAVISAAMFFPVLATYLRTGLVPNFPTLIVSGFVALTAIISIFSGLILSSITEQNRREFEYHLQIVNLHKKKMEKLK